jgi:hypothetical protein
MVTTSITVKDYSNTNNTKNGDHAHRYCHCRQSFLWIIALLAIGGIFFRWIIGDTSQPLLTLESEKDVVRLSTHGRNQSIFHDTEQDPSSKVITTALTSLETGMTLPSKTESKETFESIPEFGLHSFDSSFVVPTNKSLEDSDANTAESFHSNNGGTHHNNSRDDDIRSITCTWSPADEQDCIDFVSKRIIQSATSSETAPLVAQRHPRWIFFGDSTILRLYTYSALSRVLEQADRCTQCSLRTAGRCNMDALLQMPRASMWVPPNMSRGEGPVAFGLNNSYCQDCSGCDSRVMECVPRSDVADQCQDSRSVWGAFFSIEFARDVEVQSPQYGTTQENVVSYIQTRWNTISHLEKPICVAQAGLHDMAIPNMTQVLFLENDEWYLQLLHSVCSHVIWLGNTRVNSDEYPQKMELLFAWNQAVQSLIHRTNPHTSTFWDVWDTSLEWTMNDNVHMENNWYETLGSTFIKLIQAMASTKP